jgi:hypothetical protein
MWNQTRAHLDGVTRPLAATPNVTDDDVAVRKTGALSDHPALRCAGLNVADDHCAIGTNCPDPTGGAGDILRQVRCGNGMA